MQLIYDKPTLKRYQRLLMELIGRGMSKKKALDIVISTYHIGVEQAQVLRDALNDKGLSHA
jgi:hypothetical protein